jgi:hypothetical protein
MEPIALPADQNESLLVTYVVYRTVVEEDSI